MELRKVIDSVEDMLYGKGRHQQFGKILVALATEIRAGVRSSPNTSLARRHDFNYELTLYSESLWAWVGKTCRGGSPAAPASTGRLMRDV